MVLPLVEVARLRRKPCEDIIMDDLVTRMIAGSGRKTSKTNTYEERRSTIAAAFAGGASIRSVHRELCKSGYDMGSVRWFTIWVNQSGIQPGRSSQNTTVIATPASASSPVGDQRFRPDYQ
jgi:hypothetical protein